MVYNPYIHGPQPQGIFQPLGNQPLGGQPQRYGSTGFQVANASTLGQGVTRGAAKPVPLVNPATVVPGQTAPGYPPAINQNLPPQVVDQPSAAVSASAAKLGSLSGIAGKQSQIAALQAMLTPKVAKDDPNANLWNRRQDPRRAQMMGLVDAGLGMMQAKPGETFMSAAGRSLREGFKTSEAVRAQRIGEKTKAEELGLKRMAALTAMTKALDTNTNDMKEWDKLFPGWRVPNSAAQRAVLKYSAGKGATNVNMKIDTKDKTLTAKRHADAVTELTTMPNASVMQDTDTMLGLLEGGMNAGYGQERIMNVKRAMAGFGLLSSEEVKKMSEQQIFNKIAKTRVLDLTAKLKGSLSNKELQFITDAANQLEDNPESLKLMLNYTRIGFKRKAALANAVIGFDLEGDKQPSAREILKFSRKWAKENQKGTIKDDMIAEMEALHSQMRTDPNGFNDLLKSRYGTLGEQIWIKHFEKKR